MYTIVEGESQMIQLTLDGRPLPGLSNITWFFNGQILSSSSRVQLTSDTISWNNVVRGDAGTYTVIATNRAGSGNATFDVVVICKSYRHSCRVTYILVLVALIWLLCIQFQINEL